MVLLFLGIGFQSCQDEEEVNLNVLHSENPKYDEDLDMLHFQDLDQFKEYYKNFDPKKDDLNAIFPNYVSLEDMYYSLSKKALNKDEILKYFHTISVIQDGEDFIAEPSTSDEVLMAILNRNGEVAIGSAILKFIDNQPHFFKENMFNERLGVDSKSDLLKRMALVEEKGIFYTDYKVVSRTSKTCKRTFKYDCDNKTYRLNIHIWRKGDSHWLWGEYFDNKVQFTHLLRRLRVYWRNKPEAFSYYIHTNDENGIGNYFAFDEGETNTRAFYRIIPPDHTINFAAAKTRECGDWGPMNYCSF